MSFNHDPALTTLPQHELAGLSLPSMIDVLATPDAIEKKTAGYVESIPLSPPEDAAFAEHAVNTMDSSRLSNGVNLYVGHRGESDADAVAGALKEAPRAYPDEFNYRELVKSVPPPKEAVLIVGGVEVRVQDFALPRMSDEQIAKGSTELSRLREAGALTIPSAIGLIQPDDAVILMRQGQEDDGGVSLEALAAASMGTIWVEEITLYKADVRKLIAAHKAGSDERVISGESTQYVDSFADQLPRAAEPEPYAVPGVISSPAVLHQRRMAAAEEQARRASVPVPPGVIII